MRAGTIVLVSPNLDHNLADCFYVFLVLRQVDEKQVAEAPR